MRLIDADAAITAVLERTYPPAQFARVVQEAIDSVPTVEAVEVKLGKWLYDTDDIYDPNCKCSVCGNRELALLRWNYCPNCGARMEGDEQCD